MCAKINFLAVVPETHKNKTIYKAFFFCKKTGYLLSIKVNQDIVDFLVRKRGAGLTRDDCCLACLLKDICSNKIILARHNKNYETIFSLRWLWWKREIHTPFFYGFMVSNLYKIPMEIDESILRDQGIKITKEFLEQSLIEVVKSPLSETSADI
mgnify:FL=1